MTKRPKYFNKIIMHIYQKLEAHFKSLKRDYLKAGPIIRFFIILVSALYLNYYVFTTPLKVPSENLDKLEIKNETYLEVPNKFSFKEDINSWSLEGVVWRLVGQTSESKVCFRDKGTFLKYEDGVIYDAIATKVSFNKGDFFEVKDVECRNLQKTDTNFTFNWAFEVNISMNEMLKRSKREVVFQNLTERWTKGGSLVIYPNVETYIQIGGIWFETLKFIFIFLSLGALFKAWMGTFEFVKGQG